MSHLLSGNKHHTRSICQAAPPKPKNSKAHSVQSRCIRQRTKQMAAAGEEALASDVLPAQVATHGERACVEREPRAPSNHYETGAQPRVTPPRARWHARVTAADPRKEGCEPSQRSTSCTHTETVQAAADAMSNVSTASMWHLPSPGGGRQACRTRGRPRCIEAHPDHQQACSPRCLRGSCVQEIGYRAVGEVSEGGWVPACTRQLLRLG